MYFITFRRIMDFKYQTKEPKAIAEYMKSYMKLKPPDCSLFTEDGNEIPVHKELLCQTKLMQGLVKSFECCCSKIEIIIPSVSIEELDLMVEFLYSGQISCSNQDMATQAICNMQDFLGFSKPLCISEIKTNSFKKEEISIEKDIQIDSYGFIHEEKNNFSNVETNNKNIFY